MATILDPADLLCVTTGARRRAVAFVSHPLTNDTPPEGVIENWWLYCDDCIGRFTDPDFHVVYLHDHVDPTGSRGTDPQHQHPDPDDHGGAQ